MNTQNRLLPLAALVGLGLTAASTQAAPITAGDVIKLDVSDDGDGAGMKTTDWNTIVAFPSSIASGSVIRHGDGAVVDNITVASSLPNGGGSGEVGAIATTAWTGLGSDPYYNSLSYTDFIWNNGNSMTVTFGGLDAGLTYNVRLYHLLTEGGTVDFTVTHGAGVISRTGLNRTTLFDAVPLSADAIFEGVSADGSGNIAVNVSSGAALSMEAVVLEATGAGPDEDPPLLTGTNPADDASDVSTSADLTLTFDENVQLGPTGTITIYRASDNSVAETIDVTTPGAVLINSSVVTVVRSVELGSTTEYYVNVAAGAFTDLSDNPFAGVSGDTAWSFTTGAPPVTIAVGDVIKLDLGTAGDGDGTPGAIDDWNQVNSGANVTIGAGSVIRHGDGMAVDGVTINVSGLGTTGQANDANAAGWSGLAGDPYYNDEAFTDLVYGWGPGNLTVTFGGLDPSLTYNLRTYALINEGFADFDLTVTDGGGNIVRNNLNRSALFATTPLSADLIFEGVTPDGSGSIAATISSTDGVAFEAVVLEAVAPVPFVVELDYDPLTGMLMFSWNSRSGMVYDLLTSTTLTGDPVAWPVVAGAEGLVSDTHTMALPAEDRRFYVLRERPDPAEARVMVDTATPARDYDPMIFGGFLEHFHKQVYGGVFEPGSPLADAQGFRTDVIAALQELQVPVIRWPGGIFVDDYFWEWGVGGSRQGYLDGAWGVWEPNTFGTHEFVELCERLGAVPYFANNGKGPIEDMANWVEYTNATSGTYAAMRQANGEADPFPVPIWSVGNENYSVGFAEKVRDAAIAMKAVDPNIQITAPAVIGTIGPLLGTAGDQLDLISIHDYSFANFQTFHRPTYLQAIAESEDADGYIAAAVAQIESAGYRGQVKIAFDEWNLRSWHHPGFPWGDPNNQAQIDARDLSLDPSLYTMADALHAASFFNACLRHADDMAMANIAPLVNQSGPLYVHPGGLVKRTHFHTFAMYAQNLKSKVVDSQITSPILAGASVSLVDAIVTTDDNLSYMLALVNRDPALPVTCRVDVPGFALDGVFNATVLAGDSPDSYNDIDNPDRVVPEAVQLQFVNGVVTLPPHSLTVVHVEN